MNRKIDMNINKTEDKLKAIFPKQFAHDFIKYHLNLLYGEYSCPYGPENIKEMRK